MSEVVALIPPLLLQLLLVFGSAPLISGIIKKTKARFQRRRGASILQPYFDLAKLLRKEVVVSSVASWLFRITPYLVFSSTLVIALLVPTVVTPSLCTGSATSSPSFISLRWEDSLLRL